MRPDPDAFDRFLLAEQRAHERRRRDRIRAIAGMAIFLVAFGGIGAVTYVAISVTSATTQAVREAVADAERSLTKSPAPAPTPEPELEGGFWLGNRWVTPEQLRRERRERLERQAAPSAPRAPHRTPSALKMAFSFLDPVLPLRRLQKRLYAISGSPNLRLANVLAAGPERAEGPWKTRLRWSVDQVIGDLRDAWCSVPRTCPSCRGRGTGVYRVVKPLYVKRGEARQSRSLLDPPPTRLWRYTVVNPPSEPKIDGRDYYVANERQSCRTCGGIGTVPKGECHESLDVPAGAEPALFKAAVGW